jgi:tRNA(Arg) A34 adenosine deaminase TadA
MIGAVTSAGQETDRALLRAAIAVSVRAVANGNHPFGAVLADPAGTIVREAENTVVTGRDVTGHAETNLVRLTGDLTPEQLRDHTLYTSCEPCAMCSGAIYWSGIGRVVYALSEAELLVLAGANPENPTLALPCRTVFAAGQRPIIVVGPLLADEARVPHQTFWR